MADHDRVTFGVADMPGDTLTSLMEERHGVRDALAGIREASRSKRYVLGQTLREIDAACRARGISPSRFGILAARDPRLVFDLRNGREPRPAMRARIVALITRLEGR